MARAMMVRPRRSWSAIRSPDGTRQTDVARGRSSRPSLPHTARPPCRDPSGSLTVFQPGTKVPAVKRPDKPGWKDGEFLARKVPVVDAEAVARGPAGQRCLELGIALVEFQRAILAQHRQRAGALHQGHPLAFRELHQRGLRGEARLERGRAGRRARSDKARAAASADRRAEW